jgi:hypothetical protein
MPATKIVQKRTISPRRRNIKQLKEMQRPESSPQAEGQIVKARDEERDSEKSRGKWAGHGAHNTPAAGQRPE